jgi:DNA-binding response OmpR family regulator
LSQPDDSRNRDVLVVGTEALVASDLAVELEAQGFRTAGPFSGYDEVIPWLANSQPDCAVIDVGLKNGSSFEIARELRRRGVPMVLLSEAESFRTEAASGWSETPWIGKPVAAVHLAHILDGLTRSRGQRLRDRAA